MDNIISYEELEMVTSKLGVQVLDEKGEYRNPNEIFQELFDIWDYRRPTFSTEMEEEILNTLIKMGKERNIIDW